MSALCGRAGLGVGCEVQQSLEGGGGAEVLPPSPSVL